MGTMGFTGVMAKNIAANLNAWWSAKESNGAANWDPNPFVRFFKNRTWTGDSAADQRAIQRGLNDSGSYWKSKKKSFKNLWQ